MRLPRHSSGLLEKPLTFLPKAIQDISRAGSEDHPQDASCDFTGVGELSWRTESYGYD